MRMQQNEDATVQARRQKAGIIRCDHCGELVCQDASCSSCGAVFSREGLIDLLVSLGARKPDVPVVLQ